MKPKWWGICLLVAALGWGMYSLLQRGADFDATPVPPARPQTEDSHPHDPAAEAAWRKIQPHLAAADKAAALAVMTHCDRVSGFFAERSNRARPFAEKALGFGSKWEFLKSKLPFTDEDGLRKYLHEQFEAIVFSDAELDEAIQSAVKGCVAELQGIESALLVKIRADLNDDALGAMKGDVRFTTDTALREKYTRAVERAAKTLGKDLPVWGGREAVTWVGADLTAPIIGSLASSLIARLGLSGGILGSGVASGAITLGGGVVAAIVIDALLDRLIRALGYDPEADVEEQVRNTLRDSEKLILEGEGLEAITGGTDKKGPGKGLRYYLSTLSVYPIRGVRPAWDSETQLGLPWGAAD